MTAATGINGFIDALVAVANATFGASSLVEVVDGPVTPSRDDTGQRLYIGITDPSGVNESASSSQEFQYLSTMFRREELTVHCLATAWAGDDDFKTLRDQCEVQMRAFTAAVLVDGSFSGSIYSPHSIGASVVLAQGPNDGGNPQAELSFEITGFVDFQN